MDRKYQLKMKSLADKNDQVTNAFVTESKTRIDWMEKFQAEEGKNQRDKYQVSTLKGVIEEKDTEIKAL